MRDSPFCMSVDCRWVSPERELYRGVVRYTSSGGLHVASPAWVPSRLDAEADAADLFRAAEAERLENWREPENPTS